MSSAGATRLAPNETPPWEGPYALLCEINHMYEYLSAAYSDSLIPTLIEKDECVKEQLELITEFKRLDRLTMAACFDITFDNMVRELFGVHASYRGAPVVTRIPRDSELAIITIPAAISFHEPTRRINPVAWDKVGTLSALFGELKLASRLSVSKLTELLPGAFRNTGGFVAMRTERIRSALRSWGVVITTQELGIVLEEFDEKRFLCLIELAISLKHLEENAGRFSKILISCPALKCLGESFFHRHNIVLIEKDYLV